MENDRNIGQNNPVNSVLNNMVDKNVQSMLRPLNLMQFFSFSPKYRIKNNCISPNNLIFILYSMIGAIVLISLFIYRTYMLFIFKDHLGFNQFMIVTAFIDCAYYSFGFALNFIVGVVQSKNNIKFVLLFQRVHRRINNKTSLRNFIIGNWIIIIVVLTAYSIVSSYFNTKLNLNWFFILTNYQLIIFDLNIVYAIQVIKLLQCELKLWNVQVLNSFEVGGIRDGDFSKRMFQAYVDVLECYDIHKVCFQAYILYYIIEVFIHSLMYIEVVIESMQISVRYNTIQAATVGLFALLCWLIKDLAWLTMYMQHCEIFYLAVQRIRDSCAVILMSNCSEAERRLCKNVLRLNRASFRQIRVCGLFYPGAGFQLSLLGLLANYSVVLLQFAFL